MPFSCSLPSKSMPQLQQPFVTAVEPTPLASKSCAWAFCKAAFSLVLHCHVHCWFALQVSDYSGHNTSLFVLGVFILWFGWYGFNPGSQLAIVHDIVPVSSAAVSTTLGPACAGLSSLFTKTMIAKFTNRGSGTPCKPMRVCRSTRAPAKHAPEVWQMAGYCFSSLPCSLLTGAFFQC